MKKDFWENATPFEKAKHISEIALTTTLWIHIALAFYLNFVVENEEICLCDHEVVISEEEVLESHEEFEVVCETEESSNPEETEEFSEELETPEEPEILESDEISEEISNQSDAKFLSQSTETLGAMRELEVSGVWWTESEFDLLCKVVMAEMGSDSAPDEAQQGVAAVVINRVNHPNFKNTISEVIYTTGQYACTPYLNKVVPTQRVKENTLIALQGKSGFPTDVVWQAGFPQAAWGKSVAIYKVFDTYPHTTYFCHYGI